MDEAPPCPECGSEEQEVLRRTAEHATLQCQECRHVHTAAPRHVRMAPVGLVLSDGQRSWSDRIEVPAEEDIAVGDEFEHDGSRFLVTGLERQDGRAQERAPAAELRTCFAKRFDEVPLKLSVNEGDRTVSLQLSVDPDRPVRIGEIMEVQGRHVHVKTLKSDRNRTLHKGFLLARNVVRVFCDPAPPGAVPGRLLPVRRRGAPAKPRPRGAGPARGR